MGIQFPKDFTWGVATASYQIEGACAKDGKGPSIWDAFTHLPGKIVDGCNGDVAVDFYHRFEEDIGLMASMGLKTYRMSLSWPRIIPVGKGQVNEAGIAFYQRLFDCMESHGIEPWVTLYHWDLPLAMQIESDGWLNPTIADAFADYARVCFERFGNRVKHWITLNEPWVVAMLGYGQGMFAPGRVSPDEPYQAGHQLLRAHAKAVHVYRNEFAHQGGVIGIANNCDWREPYSTTPEDQAAAQRALEFFLGWFADPIYLGAYPQSMVERLGSRLPVFSDEDLQLIRGSSDFFGLNHYSTLYAKNIASGEVFVSEVYGNGGISEDQGVQLLSDPKWKKTQMGWSIAPWGCKRLLAWISDRYANPGIIITENGCALEDRKINGVVSDPERIEFIRGYLGAIHESMKDGIKVGGYFLWTLMDNFEWASGFTRRLGLIHVDFNTLERTQKDSAIWFGKVAGTGFVPAVNE